MAWDGKGHGMAWVGIEPSFVDLAWFRWMVGLGVSDRGDAGTGTALASSPKRYPCSVAPGAVAAAAVARCGAELGGKAWLAHGNGEEWGFPKP